MSNQIDSLDAHALETITGGRASVTGPGDPLMRQLTMLSSQLRNLGCGPKSSGFSMTFMLGLMLSQRGGLNVFVRRPYW